MYCECFSFPFRKPLKNFEICALELRGEGASLDLMKGRGLTDVVSGEAATFEEQVSPARNPSLSLSIFSQ